METIVKTITHTEEDKKKKPNPFEKRSLSDFEMKKRMFELY